MKVLSPNETYLGKSYSDYIADWCNWFFMINPDSYNMHKWNDVKFLRSFPSPHKIAPPSTLPIDIIPYEGSSMSLNTPNVMIGKEKLTMNQGQAIFFPMILAVYYNDNDETWEYMQNWVKIQNSNSDDPPAITQLLLNGETIINTSGEMKQYKLDTFGLFPLQIPNGNPSQTLKHHVLHPPDPGLYNAYCQGYFFLIYELEEGLNTMVSSAQGAPYESGQYTASFVYEIEVKPNNADMSLIPENSPQIFDMMIDELSPKSTDSPKAIHDKEYFIGIVEGSQMINECYRIGGDDLKKLVQNLYKARNEILMDYDISKSEIGIDVSLFRDISKVEIWKTVKSSGNYNYPELEKEINSLENKNKLKLMSLNKKKINGQPINISLDHIEADLKSARTNRLNNDKKQLITSIRTYIETIIPPNTKISNK